MVYVPMSARNLEMEILGIIVIGDQQYVFIHHARCTKFIIQRWVPKLIIADQHVTTATNSGTMMNAGQTVH